MLDKNILIKESSDTDDEVTSATLQRATVLA